MFCLLFAFLGAMAAERNFQSENLVFSNEKMGAKLNLSLSANADEIHIYIFNADFFNKSKLSIALRSVDKLIYANKSIILNPLEFKIISVESTLKAAKEGLELKYSFGKRDYVKSYTRLVQKELSDCWNKGTFNTVYDSLNYHYLKHGNEIPAKNIVAYLESALYFRNEVSRDKDELSFELLNKKYRISDSRGKIKAKKYKNIKLGDQRFGIFTLDGFLILSFGR